MATGARLPLALAIGLIGAFATVGRAAESGRRPNIVLVHGILNSGKIFDPMIRALQQAGWTCFAPSLTPNDCRHGVRDLAVKLAGDIDDRFGKSQPLILVGFSMGGLVTRDYVQNLADRQRVKGVFLISSPEHGTFWASLALGGGIKDLSLDSPFIQALNRQETVWRHIPVHSYWTPYDLMVLPSASSRWDVGGTTRIVCFLHPWMARDRRVIADIVRRIGLRAASGREDF